jgi:type II secretory pathway pseudopilin PulG
MIELLVSTLVLLGIMGTVMTALRQQTQQQQTIWNRTEMHSGVRGATELLQQEIGQAGRVAMPVTITLSAAAPDVKTAFGAGATCDPANPGTNASTVPVNRVDGLWATAASYALITTLDGPNRETVPLSAINAAAIPPTISACFLQSHNAGTTIDIEGAFGNGIIPPAPGVVAGFAGVANGSTATLLKMFGDINGDGNMVYVEYFCDAAGTQKLYRTSVPYTRVGFLASDTLVLLNNVRLNPGGEKCFTYQAANPIIIQGQPLGFVLDVAITLTVQTQQVDPVTKQFQTETKALLNVSPRNVFNAWQLGQWTYPDRIQSTPATVTALMAIHQ